MSQVNKDLTPDEITQLKAIESILSDKEDLSEEEVQQLKTFFSMK